MSNNAQTRKKMISKCAEVHIFQARYITLVKSSIPTAIVYLHTVYIV